MDAVNFPGTYDVIFAVAWCVLFALACFAGIRRLKNAFCVVMLGAVFLAFKFAGNENFLWLYAAFAFAFVCVIVAWFVPFTRRSDRETRACERRE